MIAFLVSKSEGAHKGSPYKKGAWLPIKKQRAPTRGAPTKTI